ncbi:uncharacterized protein LOC122508792 [Leptopilina heterotoma]|uniref:uncharacterized protein LOC122508792 n=1 Tax=Leptopilina heterotoma TaxID=63436 RepID=UPI001CA9A970|nr:uncharacterized protein LOC122508792 [Leptopilina heterotoma]
MAKDESTTKPFSSQRCFNCSKNGHIAADCRFPKRPVGACFKCFELGHQSKDCLKKRIQLQGKNQIANVSMDVPDDLDLENILEKQCFKTITYEIDVEKEICLLSLDTLFDTGSPISFIKESRLPAGSVQPCPSDSSQDYTGINNSVLVRLGLVTAKVRFNDIETKITVYVVPDNTMQVSVILGRDVLSKFNLGLLSLSKIEVEAIGEIFAIDHGTDSVVDFMQINPDIDFKIKSQLKNIFLEEYINKERPEFPNVNIKLVLKLTSDKTIMFGPRRLSFEEKIKLRAILDDLVARKIIRESDSKYASPIVLTRKKNGDLRLCVDY